MRCINKADEIEDEDLKKWFEDYEKKAKESGKMSLEGRNSLNSLYSLRAIRTKEKKIKCSSEIEDEDLRRWFDAHQEVSGEYYLYQLKRLKKNGESEYIKNNGCGLAYFLFIGLMILGTISSWFDEKEEKTRGRIQYTPSSTGSGMCNYPSDIARDGSRCGGRAASER